MFNSLQPHRLQHARPPCPSLSSVVCPKFTQVYVHWVGDAIQPSHPLSPSSPFAFDSSQHQTKYNHKRSNFAYECQYIVFPIKVIHFFLIQIKHLLNVRLWGYKVEWRPRFCSQEWSLVKVNNLWMYLIFNQYSDTFDLTIRAIRQVLQWKCA